MKIGILTYTFANNYGAAFQVLALQQTLINFGYDVEIINYISERQYNNNSLIDFNFSVKSFARNIVRLPHFIERYQRISKFNKFRDSRFKLSTKRISNVKELSGYVESSFDLIIVGSDQVWNPNADDFDDVYFMISKFNIPVMTYAASLGDASFQELSKYKSFIGGFKSVSLRENSNKDTILNLCKTVNPIINLDPTLLLNKDFYNGIAQNGLHLDYDYVLCYYLGRKNSRFIYKFIRNISNRLKLKFVFIDASNGIISYMPNVINTAGPEDFISLIKGAKVVFTNSFHATAISIKLGVSFYSIENSNSKDHRNSDLLIQLGLTDRLVPYLTYPDSITIDNSDIITAQRMLNDLSTVSSNSLYNEINLIMEY